MLAGESACARFAFKNVVIKSVHILIASLLTLESFGACIILEGGCPAIEGIHMLFTGSFTRECTGTGVALVHFGRARGVVEMLLYGDSG